METISLAYLVFLAIVLSISEEQTDLEVYGQSALNNML